jgi:hypothetical protein
MSSNTPSANLLSKTNQAQPYSNSSSFHQAGPVNVPDTSFQKRSGSSGTFRAGATTRNTPQGRSNQPLRKQHKTQRRARLADEDAIAESAAMKSINGRRGQTSITHLMNFTLPPRPSLQQQQQQHQYHHFSHNRYQRRNPAWGLGSGYHAVDKARYLHANYRFIVKPDRTYSAQAADADVHLQWDAVMQVLASAETQLASCPICLSTPVAPRIAKCGHIFCLPCLIRYMHSTDDANPVPEKRARWKKCPICEDSIYISETRPVRWFTGQEASSLQEGGDILLRLLIREPGNSLALPRDAGERFGLQEDIPWYHAAEVMDYARFMKGGQEYMKSQYDAEIEELHIQEKEDELMFGDDTTWTKKAVVAINEAKQRLQGMADPPEISKGEADHKPQRPPVVFNPPDNAPDMYRLRQTELSNNKGSPNLSARSTRENKSPGATSSTDLDALPAKLGDLSVADQSNPELTKPTSSIRTPHLVVGRSNGSSYFFYNALPNFYLSPLDIRILKAAYGPFSAFPSTILPRLEHVSTGHVIDDDLRKRAKYLAHLPYGCEVSFVECDWTDVISATVLGQFSAEIDRRRKKHHEKEMREERDRLRAEKEEDDKRWAAARRKRPSFVEKSFSESDFQPLLKNDVALGMSPSASNALSATPPWSGTRHRSSFAPLASPGTSPEAPKTVWGTAAVPPSSPALIAAPHDDPPADDGWLQGWEKDLLDNEDAATIVATGTMRDGSPMRAAAPNSRHKKKNKKITLMSTNARRAA